MSNWEPIKRHLIAEVDLAFGVFEKAPSSEIASLNTFAQTTFPGRAFPRAAWRWTTTHSTSRPEPILNFGLYTSCVPRLADCAYPTFRSAQIVARAACSRHSGR